MSSRSERYARSYLAVDDRLETAPTQALLVNEAYYASEWTYTIDLDRELLAVDKAVHFILHKLPHYPTWHHFLSIDSDGRRVLKGSTPSELVGDATNKADVDGQMSARYRYFHVETGELFTEINYEPKNHSRDKLLIDNLLALFRTYQNYVEATYLEWTSASFPFREIAFAILSIAAGEVAFGCPPNLNQNYADEGFFLVPGEHADA
ncbi:hypothetical protein BJX70DRAFT_96076 [Aspergillus crustosus]